MIEHDIPETFIIHKFVAYYRNYDTNKTADHEFVYLKYLSIKQISCENSLFYLKSSTLVTPQGITVVIRLISMLQNIKIKTLNVTGIESNSRVYPCKGY